MVMTDPLHGADPLSTARALIVDAAAAKAAAALGAAGVPCLLLRGPALASVLYDDPAQRPYLDVDLLVEPDRLSEAEAALTGSGFDESALEAAFPEGRPQHAHTWRSAFGGVVDVHRTLIGVAAAPPTVWRVLNADVGTISVEGVRIDVPSLSARALIVALHAAHHVDTSGQVLDDLERAVSRLGLTTWVEAADLARKLEAVGPFVSGLSLVPDGRALLQRLDLSPAASPLAGEDRGERSFHVAQGILWLSNTPGAMGKVRFARRRLLPPPRTMRQRSRLARRGLVGLGAAYVVRLLGALRRLPTALAGLRRTRR
jgi:hypothetical protein